MELILAIVVATAVIFFGALISMGNERQRNAINDLREQIVLWATQDLRIKREKLKRDIQVNDPISWLNRTASIVAGCNLDLELIESFDQPKAIICVSRTTTRNVIFSPHSREQILRFFPGKRSRLLRFTNSIPLFVLPRNVTAYEISVLNSDILFDVELPLVWKSLSHQDVSQMDRLWMYVTP